MGKLVILKLLKNAGGFKTILEVSDAHSYPHTIVSGQLRSLEYLLQHYQEWQAAYYRLGESNRAVRPIGITMEGTMMTRRKSCLKLAEKLQFQFNEWLRTAAFYSIRETLLRQLQATDLVQVIIQSDDPKIFKLPWQQWDLLEKFSFVEIGFSSLDYESLSPVRSRHPPLRILAILGQATEIDVEQDRFILAQLPGAEVEFLAEPTRQDLSIALWNQDWDILFFAGHSDSEADRGYIYLNSTDRLTLGELRATLAQSVKRGLQLAIFNSCDGLGLAQELKSLGIPQIIVMREPVPDRVAQLFLKHFLQAFAQGESLHRSLRQAREKLEGFGEEFPCASWLPMLMQNPAAPPFYWPIEPSLPCESEAADVTLGWPARWRRLALLTILITTGVAAIRFLGGLQPVELWAFDWFMQLRPNEKPDERLLLVEVTEENLRQYGGATISDQLLAKGLNILETNGARVIGVDIYRDIPQPPGRTELIQRLQQNDRIFVICQHAEAEVDPGTPPPAEIAPRQVGFSDVVLDADDVVRRHLFSMQPTDRSACTTEYALSLLVAGTYLTTEGFPESGTTADALQFGDVILRGMNAPTGGYQQADLGAYQMLLNYRHVNNSVNQLGQWVTFDKLITGQVDSSAIADRIVLIGITAESRKDEFRTPYEEKIKGVALHAQMVSQIISAVLDGRPLLWTWHWSGDLFWILAWSSLGALVPVICSNSRQFWLTELGLILLLSGVCFVAFWQLGLWLPWIPPVIALILTSVACQRSIDSRLGHSV